jgi:hypothetical protein
MADFNVKDPAVQEKIRRGSHEYVPGAGRHGEYVPSTYLHQEYPKVMDRTPAPIRKAFKTDDEFKAAVADWEEDQKNSTVKNKSEEDRWLAAHGKKPATSEATAAPAKKGKRKSKAA